MTDLVRGRFEVLAGHGRYPFAATLAFGATALVFWGLTQLIEVPSQPTEETISLRVVDMALPPEKKLPVNHRDLPVKPNPPAMPPHSDGLLPKDIVVIVDPAPLKRLTDLKADGPPVIDLMAPVSDREGAPLVRVEPAYPAAALNRGVEGYVTLRFSIDGAGAVIADSIEVVEAFPPSIFNAAAVRAVKKWKYAPRIVDGKAVPQPNMRTSLTFQME